MEKRKRHLEQYEHVKQIHTAENESGTIITQRVDWPDWNTSSYNVIVAAILDR